MYRRAMVHRDQGYGWGIVPKLQLLGLEVLSDAVVRR